MRGNHVLVFAVHDLIEISEPELITPGWGIWASVLGSALAAAAATCLYLAPTRGARSLLHPLAVAVSIALVGGAAGLAALTAEGEEPESSLFSDGDTDDAETEEIEFEEPEYEGPGEFMELPGAEPAGLLYAEGALWVSDGARNQVLKIDAASRAVVGPDKGRRARSRRACRRGRLHLRRRLRLRLQERHLPHRPGARDRPA